MSDNKISQPKCLFENDNSKIIFVLILYYLKTECFSIKKNQMKSDNMYLR